MHTVGIICLIISIIMLIFKIYNFKKYEVIEKWFLFYLLLLTGMLEALVLMETSIILIFMVIGICTIDFILYLISRHNYRKNNNLINYEKKASKREKRMKFLKVAIIVILFFVVLNFFYELLFL